MAVINNNLDKQCVQIIELQSESEENGAWIYILGRVIPVQKQVC